MSLRELAATDARSFVEDPAGFGWPVTVTDPGGITAELVGLSTDIGTTIDPDTGQAVTGRRASIALSISSLETEFEALPNNVPEVTRRPWVVTFLDVDDHTHNFKVVESLPDRAIGIIVCLLEVYEYPISG